MLQHRQEKGERKYSDNHVLIIPDKTAGTRKISEPPKSITFLCDQHLIMPTFLVSILGYTW